MKFENVWKAFVQYDPCTDTRGLHMVFSGHREPKEGGRFGNEYSDAPKRFVVAPFEFKEVDGFAKNEPAFVDDYNAVADGISLLQAIVDACWEAGIKPKKIHAHESEMAAVRYHLEDMRKLAKVK
jgi:hypothetical protein